MDLEKVKTQSAKHHRYAYIATVGADGKPDVAPIDPAWEGDTIWIMTFGNSVKARNIAHQPSVAMHWQVPRDGDGVEVWGNAEVHSEVETKRRLWKGVFDYNLSDFAPGGPEESPHVVFVSVRPERALFYEGYGQKTHETWSA